MKRIIILSILLTLACSTLFAQSLPLVNPEKAGMDKSKLIYVDNTINQSVQDGDIPGAVLAVVRHKKLAYLKAYGNKQVYPETVAMTTNTVFDLASLSKSVSTAISTMILLERGQLRLRDQVAMYIPGFQPWTDTITGRKRNIRIIDLLTHTSGLPPYAPVEELKKQYTVPNPDGLITYISNVKRNNEPTKVFDYSCLNFITLQRIIENISGMSLQNFARQNIFSPLGMKHTDYNPTGETLEWTAPTEKQADGSVLKGKVHDPLANIMNGGVSGNAGVFSNAEDIAILAAMLLNDGEIDGIRILSPLTVRAMRSVPKGFEEFGRSLGWDVYSGYASDGDLFDVSAYGHTGYTGTSITIDPDSGTAVILLTNRVHPDDKGAVSRLREIVANVVAASIIKVK
ncbi:Beta-lactamase [uncultured Dysgonomonas sp.]|uniref:Beta-lactamase n=1 Tax=uncultured Dysgonomonas sp. TaxID=206096 RepID=A0A212JX79_9BACT|nr:Beta-lactamase [uncultured Dysgonomonas sp.]